MNEETAAALALSLTPGLGLKRLHGLLLQENSPGQILKLSARRMKGLRLPPEARASLRSGRSQRLAEEVAERALKGGIHILSPYAAGYPRLLSEIYDPPLVLYALGDSGLLERPSVALVGSRRCSVYGRQVASRLSRELATTGLVIVSGLARGIDALAHRGALEAQGATVAVLGSGVDVPYPRENRDLYDQVAQRGCILSEFPCGSFPAPQNFPIRNRIISGLSLGTIIGEAAEFSGSLITARLALEQNRELWAVPGNITSKGSYGPNYLIKQGATVVIEAQDVLEQLPLHVLETLRREPAEVVPAGESADCRPLLSGRERAVLKLLPVDRGLHLDQLLQKGGFNTSELSQILLELQIKGQVIQAPGQLYSRKLF